jgi:hypothetical protein
MISADAVPIIGAILTAALLLAVIFLLNRNPPRITEKELRARRDAMRAIQDAKSAESCRTWQKGPHIDSMPVQRNEPNLTPAERVKREFSNVFLIEPSPIEIASFNIG